MTYTLVELAHVISNEQEAHKPLVHALGHECEGAT